MTADRSPPDAPGAGAGAGADDGRSWREHAVARSLDPFRQQAERRVGRFLDAAVELLSVGSGRELTVQAVVDRAGQSLRSFYQHFAGKHELLLAVFEEALRSTADHLADLIVDVDDPLDRLHHIAVGYYWVCRPAPRPGLGLGLGPGPTRGIPAPVMGELARPLLIEHPEEAARAYAPLVALFEQVFADAAAAGCLRPGLDAQRDVGVLLQVISFHAFSATISGTPLPPGPDDERAAEELWQVLFQGIGCGPAPGASRPA
jgi:AcrR family transcriptional regulator